MGNKTIGIKIHVAGTLPTISNCPTSSIDKLTKRWKAAVARVIQGSTASGKTTFFTYVACSKMSPGERPKTSAANKWMMSPENNTTG